MSATLRAFLDVSPVVRAALRGRHPVVALESAVVTHGLPHPHNVDTALRVEEAVRAQGATPATIAVVHGRLKVGVDEDTLHTLAQPGVAIKTASKDYPYVIAKGLHGGTTVSATVWAAHAAGIPLVSTGGCGGVHRGGAATMDVSADLVQLGRTPVGVVCSGVKSLLDVGRTLEYLETQGVCVVTYGAHRDFPAFYSAESGLRTAYYVDTPGEAAAMLHALLQLRGTSGMILGVPVPQDKAIPAQEVEEVVRAAEGEAAHQGVTGNAVTPFILQRLHHLTGGRTLAANTALLENNARVAAQVAVKLSERNPIHSNNTPKLVVVGGCVLDSVATLADDTVQTDGRTLPGSLSRGVGGVGRNLADALARLGCHPLLVSVVGVDGAAEEVAASLSHLDTRGVRAVPGAATATYLLVVRRDGECLMGVGDMAVHGHLGPSMVEEFAKDVEGSPLVVMDGNLPQDTVDHLLGTCRCMGVPVWFEPTDVSKAVKVFHTGDLWTSVSFTSPNINELRAMATKAGVTCGPPRKDSDLHPPVVMEAAFLSSGLAQHGLTVVTTLGSLGVMVTRRGGAGDALYRDMKPVPWSSSDQVSARLYACPRVERVVNVSGAGDCFAAGFMAAMLRGLPEATCVSVGTASAGVSLGASSAVPRHGLLGDGHSAWGVMAPCTPVLASS